MALVERQDVAGAVLRSEDDDGCVSEADAKLFVFPDNRMRLGEICFVEGVQLIRTPRNLIEKQKLCLDA